MIRTDDGRVRVPAEAACVSILQLVARRDASIVFMGREEPAPMESAVVDLRVRMTICQSATHSCGPVTAAGAAVPLAPAAKQEPNMEMESVELERVAD